MIYDDGNIQLYQGDALEILAEMLAQNLQVDAVVTDPPYASGGLHRGSRVRATIGKYVEANIKLPVGFDGDQKDQRGWASWSYLWTGLTYDLTRNGGNLFSFIDWRQLPLLSDIVQISGWAWQGLGVWHKGFGRPQKNKFASSHELVLHAVKGSQTPTDLYAPGVFHQAIPKDKQHITQKPIETIEWLFRLLEPDHLILDPFAGSGTTLIAAKKMGRKAIGIESNPEHCATIIKRLEANT